IKNDGHYFCGAGGNRPDGLNEPVTYITLIVIVHKLTPDIKNSAQLGLSKRVLFIINRFLIYFYFMINNFSHTPLSLVVHKICILKVNTFSVDNARGCAFFTKLFNSRTNRNTIIMLAQGNRKFSSTY
ncbi:hypothetical protein FHD46_20760, partial [Escherichia coli]|nr:hypothetical protein [Escherichia coli]